MLGLEVEPNRIADVLLERSAAMIVEAFSDGAYAFPDICGWTESAADLVNHVVGRTSLVKPRVARNA